MTVSTETCMVIAEESEQIEVEARNGDRNESQTVLRACEVLKAFRHLGEELPLTEVMLRTSLPKTTCFRLLRTLIHGGLVERVSAGIYRNSFGPVKARPFRVGFAAEGESVFSHEVTCSLEAVASREHLQLITLNNRSSVREALRNADLLVRERVDLVIEFQTYSRIAPEIAAKFHTVGIPMISIDVPHAGATYFGADNYKAGYLGGKALGRWARDNWNGQADQLVLLEMPVAGPLLELRSTGFVDGLRSEVPSIMDTPLVRLNGRGEYEQVLDVLRKYMRRRSPGRTLIGTVNDICSMAALQAFEEAGEAHLCAIMGQQGTLAARSELRRAGTRLIGTVAHFPERYGDELVPLALNILARKPVPATSYVKHQLLTPRNVDLIYPLDRISMTHTSLASLTAHSAYAAV